MKKVVATANSNVLIGLSAGDVLSYEDLAGDVTLSLHLKDNVAALDDTSGLNRKQLRKAHMLHYKLEMAELVRGKQQGTASETVYTAPGSPKLVSRLRKKVSLSPLASDVLGYSKGFRMDEPEIAKQDAFMTTAEAVAMGMRNIPLSCPCVDDRGAFQLDNPEILQTSVSGKTALAKMKETGDNIFDILNDCRVDDIQQLLVFLMAINACDNHGDNIMIDGDRVGAVDFENGFLETGVAKRLNERKGTPAGSTYITFDSILMGTSAFSMPVQDSVEKWALQHLDIDYLVPALSHVQIPGGQRPVLSLDEGKLNAFTTRVDTIFEGIKRGQTLKEIAQMLYPVSVAVIDALTERCDGKLDNEVYQWRNISIREIVRCPGISEEKQVAILEALGTQSVSVMNNWESSSDEEGIVLPPPASEGLPIFGGGFGDVLAQLDAHEEANARIEDEEKATSKEAGSDDDDTDDEGGFWATKPERKGSVSSSSSSSSGSSSDSDETSESSKSDTDTDSGSDSDDDDA